MSIVLNITPTSVQVEQNPSEVTLETAPPAAEILLDTVTVGGVDVQTVKPEITVEVPPPGVLSLEGVSAGTLEVELAGAGPQGVQGSDGSGVVGNDEYGRGYLKNNAVSTPIPAPNAREVVAGNFETNGLLGFENDATTNSLKYTGAGGRFHVLATFSFSTTSGNVCGFYIGHNTDDSTPLDPDGDRSSTSEIYVNAGPASSQPRTGAIQEIFELSTGDRLYFIVQNQTAANPITVQFLKLIAAPLTSEKGEPGADGVDAPTWTDYATRWDSPPSVAGSVIDGQVFLYTLDGTDRFRFVPTVYDPTLDAFYSAFDGSTLSGLLVTRAT